MASNTIEENSFENPIDLSDLYLNSEKWSNVNFLFTSCEGTKRVPAHKLLLANGSDVFAAMFYGGLKEKGDVTVTDASADAFEEFLQFFYLNRVQLTMKNVAEVMNLGHKYNVANCVDVCAQFLKGAMDHDTVCLGLGLATLYDDAELQKVCETHIAIHSEAVFKSKNFVECDKSVLARILKLDSLNCSETVIFEACMSWVKAKSGQNEVTKQLIHEHLGELFYEIRLVAMTIEEFGALSMKHKYAFSLDEHQDIFHTITFPQVSSKLFNGIRRSKVWNDGAIISCDRKIAGPTKKWWHISSNRPVQFESNQPMLLGTLVFAPISLWRNYQDEDLESDLPIDVTIIEAANKNGVCDGSTRTLSNFQINLPSKKETSITLPAPVSVRPGFHYKIQLDSQQFTDEHVYACGGPQFDELYYYEYGSLMAEVQMENNFFIKFHDCYIATGIFNLITGLGFNRI